jgi:dipeptidyl-peptidase-4
MVCTPMIGTQPISDTEFLRAITETRSFTNGAPQSIQLTPDGKTVLFLRGQPRKNELRLFAFDLETKSERELASAESVLGNSDEALTAEERARRERMRITARGIVGYQLARNGQFAVFMLSGRAFAIAVSGGNAQELAGADELGESGGIFDPQLAPDSAHLAFVRGGELWVTSFELGKDAAEPVQLTFGATETLLHARAEFVAQEELARFRGYWWSPDSRSIVYEEVDESKVDRLYLQDPANEFREPQAQAYPRPGRSNARCRFGVIQIAPAADESPRETRWLQLDPKFEYVARIEWPAPETLLAIALTRDQRELALLSFDPDGNPTTLITERDELFLNSARELIWMPQGHGFLWSSDRFGQLQLFQHASDGALLRTLTSPEFRFTALHGFDPKSGMIFVTRNATPLAAELWELPVGDDGAATADASGQAKKLAPSTGLEGVQAQFASRSRVHVRSSAPPIGPVRFEVFDASGALAGTLRSLAETPPIQPQIELRQVGHGGPDRFHSLLVRPSAFEVGKKYPLLLLVYGGPHVNTVRANANSYATDQWIADHGFLVLRADNRGTPLRGRDWERAISGKFADVPLDDQIAALQAWSAFEPAIDLARVGIMGHSFGGFLASLAVLRRPDVFRAAVAGAPVVDWRNYDTAYTERYLGVPPLEGNELYSSNGLLRYAADPDAQHRPLLISHGTADDNVHFSESLLLADALFRAGKPFELIPQLGQTHQLHEPALQARYWERIFAFFKQHLGQASP